MIETVKKWAPEFSHFEEAPVLVNGQEVGWHCHSIMKDGKTLAGGTHPDRETAMRIAVAELLERSVVKTLPKDERFLLDEFPTTCGFAAGFERNTTRFRAVCEALERWAWSQWIDKKYRVERSSGPTSMTPLMEHLAGVFDQVLYFQREIVVPDADFGGRVLRWGVCLGVTGSGIYPGSRVTSSTDDLWLHPLVEAWRHRKIHEVRMNGNMDPESMDFVIKRIVHFGTHSEEALTQIESATQMDWPPPRLRLLREVDLGNSDFFVWRALAHDFLGWHEGSHERFVY